MFELYWHPDNMANIITVTATVTNTVFPCLERNPRALITSSQQTPGISRSGGSPRVCRRTPCLRLCANSLSPELKKHSQSDPRRSQAQFQGNHLQVTQLSDGSAKQIVAMRMDIQIYEMERGAYLVDFKCDGYETSDGRLLEDKEVASPFPFLDMAARLIMQLADAGD
jgi:hypothetical protein